MLLHKRQIVLILAWLVLIFTQAIAIYQGEPYISSCFPISKLAIALTFWLELIAIILTGIAFILTATRRDVTEHPQTKDELCTHQQELSMLPEFTDGIKTFKQTQAALQSNQNLMHTVIENLPNGGVFLFDQNLRFILAAGLGLGVVGITKADIEGKTIWEALPPETSSEVELPYRQAFAGISSRFEAPYGHRVYEVHVLPVRNDDGEIFAGMTITQEITERKQSELALQDALQLLNLHIDTTPLAVVQWDCHLCVTRWSSTAEKIFGWRTEEVIGKHFQDLHMVYEEDMTAVAEASNRLLSGQEAQIIQYNRNYTKDSRVIYCEWYNSSITNEAGSVTSVLSLVLDVTERIQAEKALRQSELMVIEERAQALERERAARIELERASRMKDEFLAIVSHELRSPLNGILGWSRLLRTRKLSPEKIEQALESIERNAQAQTQLIEDLLDISRIIRGNIRLLVRPMKLIPVIQAALDTVRPIANTKSIQIISRLSFDIGLVSADPERLQQVIWNLLSNAVKFTPEGGRVEICLEQVETNVQIQVTDTGKGISPEFLPYVFDRFRQADATTTRNQGGLGLGLAIVRNLVELHNGTVSVASPGEGQGATFTVQLPLLPSYSTVTPEEPLLQRQTAWDAKVQIRGLKILAVDDEPDTREFLKTALEQYGAIVTTAASTSEALKLLQLVKPDVLLSDIGMPNEDGYALIRQIRALSSEQGGNVPAAALTAYTRQSDRLLALTAGFQIHISKPIEPIQLLKIVATLAGNNSN
ncbi:ATP-binding protein [Anabaena sp. CCY 9910]|uniref:PAS domain-containing hybrid sensor histidine kinase/response regulator n=1 Tax=Anabaena sp. CCY 9910 TaxID=3103870 RepID=UPI0039E1F9E7